MPGVIQLRTEIPGPASRALLARRAGAGQGSQSSLEAVLLALAAVAVHGGAMLLVTGLVALGVVNGGLVLAGRWKSP